MSPQHRERLEQLMSNPNGMGMPAARDLAIVMAAQRVDSSFTCRHCGSDCAGECEAPQTHPLRSN